MTVQLRIRRPSLSASLTPNEELLNEAFELDGRQYSRLSEFAAVNRIDNFTLARLLSHTMDLDSRTPAKLAALLLTSVKAGI